MTDTTARTARKKQLEQTIRQLRAQLESIGNQYDAIKREEYLEEEHAKKIAREEALFRLRKRLRDTVTIKKQLMALPPSDLNKIGGNAAISWITSSLDMREKCQGSLWGSLSSHALSGGEQEGILQMVKDLIKEIRQERKQAWLANHAPGTRRV